MGRLNIVFAFDDGYAQHAGVAIKSMLVNCSKPSDLKVIILDGGISKKNKYKLKVIIKQHSAVFKFIKISELLKKKNFVAKGHFGIMTYARYFISEIIPHSKSLIYLDSDIIVLGDIIELKQYFNHNVPLYAVSEGKVSKGGVINLNEGDDYFNAGVLIINSYLWRKKHLTETLVKFTQENVDLLKYADQDVLNNVFKGNWLCLPAEWNITLDASFKRFSLDRQFFCLKDYYKNAKMVHFASPLKPWYFR
ncbi:MAG: glycosyltransferase family 8 protein, partial [Sphaerochaetaceae bacterium]|nr:glycosyltransferase family 8 protein [Sphaerochaetaceae bacterium]